MPKKYNGHPSWNHWNVSLWINNDEELYNCARSAVIQYGAKYGASVIARTLHGQKTPDGAPYLVTYIRHAIRGILS